MANEFSFEYYLARCQETAQFPEPVGERYVLYGLIGEVGEFMNKFKKLLRGDYSEVKFSSNWIICHIPDRFVKDFIAELGDITWYVAMISDEYGVTIADFIPDDGELACPCLEDAVDRLILKAGIVSCDYALASRGDVTESESLKALLQAVGNVACCLGSSLLEVTERNTEKLKARKADNTIKGAGDNR